MDEDWNVIKRQRIGKVDDLSWPVIGPGQTSFYAVQQSRLVRLSEESDEVKLMDDTLNWRKLLGIDEEGTLLGIAMIDGNPKLAAVTSDNEVVLNSDSTSPEMEKQVAILLEEARLYKGDLEIRSERSTYGFDVVLKSGDQTINLSEGGNNSCSQGSLSPDFRMAAYILTPRY